MNTISRIAAAVALASMASGAFAQSSQIDFRGSMTHTCSFSNATEGTLDLDGKNFSTLTTGSIDVTTSLADLFKVSVPGGRVTITELPGPASAFLGATGGYPELSVNGVREMRPEWAELDYVLPGDTTTLDATITAGSFDNLPGTGDVVLTTVLTCSAN